MSDAAPMQLPLAGSGAEGGGACCILRVILRDMGREPSA